MNYEQFRAAWYEALTEAGMWSYLAPPTASESQEPVWYTAYPSQPPE